jgi:LysR family hydrogen peroxide-inducible transcriptional activator
VDHPLAGKDRVEARDLRGVELLALGPGHQLRDVVVALASEVGAKIRFDYEGTSLDTLREMMATGLGVTVLPGLYVRSVLSNDDRFRTYEISGLDMHRTIAMLWRTTTPRREIYERLAELFRKAVGLEFGGLPYKPHGK